MITAAAPTSPPPRHPRNTPPREPACSSPGFGAVQVALRDIDWIGCHRARADRKPPMRDRRCNARAHRGCHETCRAALLSRSKASLSPSPSESPESPRSRFAPIGLVHRRCAVTWSLLRWSPALRRYWPALHPEVIWPIFGDSVQLTASALPLESVQASDRLRPGANEASAGLNVPTPCAACSKNEHHRAAGAARARLLDRWQSPRRWPQSLPARHAARAIGSLPAARSPINITARLAGSSEFHRRVSDGEFVDQIATG